MTEAKKIRTDLKLAFLGPQGSGKGTQAQILADRFHYTVLGMGAMLREAAKAQTPEAEEIKRLTTAGVLVPTELTITILLNHLKQLTASGLILDGFPRSLDQAEQLEQIRPLDSVVVFEISDQEAIRRIVTRVSCPQEHVFNTITHPPKVSGICDYDGQPLTRREDDQEEAVRQRLAIYHAETAKVIDYYQSLNKLLRVNGEQEIGRIAHHLELLLRQL
ncbi:MAG: nucleoside monophosphate kinase [Candidatus Komeilibacteria bacterium]